MINYGLIKTSSKKELCFLVPYKSFKKLLLLKNKENVIYPKIKLRKRGMLFIYDITFCTFEGEALIYNNKIHKLILPI